MLEETSTGNKMKLYGKTIIEGNLPKIAGLLSKGADIDSTDKDGKTALYWASFNGNTELATFLIEHKAKITIAAHNGNTPLDIARELALGGYREPGEDNKHAQIVKILKDALCQKEVGGIMEKISNLGIHAKKGTPSNSAPAQEPKQTTNDRWCTIL